MRGLLLETFILRFTNGELSPRRWSHPRLSSRSARAPSRPVDGFYLPRLETSRFNDTLLQSSEVIYSRIAGYCLK